VLAPQGVEFAAFEIPKERADLSRGVSRLVVVPELREVRVQISFSRFAALSANLQGEYDFSKLKVRPAVLTLPTGNEKWLPAAEIRGEGIFFELDHLREAWDLGRLCSNDPVCAAHNPVAEGSDRRLEGAACHGCLYVAECSCERFNRFLDRALVVPTIGNDPALGFFRERP
jgi:hypothetical protein